MRDEHATPDAESAARNVSSRITIPGSSRARSTASAARRMRRSPIWWTATGKRIASGFYSRASQIRLRALTFGDEELTRGADRVAHLAPPSPAVARSSTRHNAARLIHAEGDDLSSIVVDRYDDMVVVEIANRGAEQLKPLIVDTLQRELAPRVIFFKNDLPARKLEGLPTENECCRVGELESTSSDKLALARHSVSIAD